MGRNSIALIELIKTLVMALVLVAVVKTFAFASYYIPSESMVPTLEIGDRIFVNKIAYGYSRYSLPIPKLLPSFPGQNGRILHGAPERGDVVVFSNPHTGETTIKRLIGLPGDRIQLSYGRLMINGELIQRKKNRIFRYRDPRGRLVKVHEYLEILPNGQNYKILERSDDNSLDDTGVYFVPKGHVFLMGDNRDNSTDSRALNLLGYVPLENIIGRADLIPFSLYHCKKENGASCGKRRFFTWVK